MFKEIDEMLDEIIEIEGGYSNDIDDLGRETKYGITEQVAREHNYEGPIKELPMSVAKDIYYKTYWVDAGYEKIAKHSFHIAYILFNSAVNTGITRTNKWLQRSLNLYNEIELLQDGLIGLKTENALTLFLSNRYIDGEDVLIKTIKGLQTYHYIEITEKRPKNRKYIYGWISNRIM